MRLKDAMQTNIQERMTLKFFSTSHREKGYNVLFIRNKNILRVKENKGGNRGGINRFGRLYILLCAITL